MHFNTLLFKFSVLTSQSLPCEGGGGGGGRVSNKHYLLILLVFTPNPFFLSASAVFRLTIANQGFNHDLKVTFFELNYIKFFAKYSQSIVSIVQTRPY